MNLEVTINYEITNEGMEKLADDYLQMVVDRCEGDEGAYCEVYLTLIEDNADLLNFIESYPFTINDEDDYFTGLDIETQDLFELCKEIRKIVLRKMKEDFKNFA